eukprot:TRINITY_DN25992_c0_g3_i1.p1 TRINITY_DN25992_c0_g3~~TRINITY_DN25992_c0_g3_i1.p1  ORF type:complete len:786 (+),score=205.09 TRINITY_DN25992_c0_g3_i1:314-2359(+)
MSAAGYSYQQAAAYGYSAAAMAAYGGYGGSHAYAAAAATSDYGMPEASSGRRDSMDDDDDADKSSGSLFDELKAKHSARTTAREELARLKAQLAAADRRDRRLCGALQQKIEEAEHRLRLTGDRSEGGLRDSVAELRRRLRPPEDGRVDQFGRFCHVLVQFLRSCDDCAAPLARLTGERRVQQEWTDLERSRIVEAGVTLKDLLLERSSTFELYDDERGQSCVRLLLEGSGRDGGGSADARSGDGRGVEGGGAAGLALRPDQVANIEAYLKKAGGSERVSRLETMFDVKKSQLARHFTLYEDRKRLYATPMPARSLASSASSGGPGCAANVGGSGAQAGAGGAGAASAELRQLELLLQKLTPRRSSIAEAMAFCLEHAVTHAATIARSLIRAVEEPGLRTEGALARLFLVSDVLYNSNCGAKGASRYSTSFQELLPDACERLGRQWLQRLERGRLEQTRAESSVRKALAAWQDWGVFPELFVRGLEALLFQPVPDDASTSPGDEDADEVLKQKLATWRSAADAARLPYAARLRGLSGSALPTALCRARLCHYERYWHRPGEDAEEQLPLDDPWGEKLRRASLGEAATRDSSPKQVPILSHVEVGRTLGAVTDDVVIDAGEDGLDGESLSSDDERTERSDCLRGGFAIANPGEGGPTLGEGIGSRVSKHSGVDWAAVSDPYM